MGFEHLWLWRIDPYHISPCRFKHLRPRRLTDEVSKLLNAADIPSYYRNLAGLSNSPKEPSLSLRAEHKMGLRNRNEILPNKMAAAAGVLGRRDWFQGQRIGVTVPRLQPVRPFE
jgi:hypothetical protein